jgi:Transmembrane domain of unknown function (DUF3566)
VSTEEDGVDEPTRSTKPSLIMAPPGLEADPDGEVADAAGNNGTMAPSRMRAGSSRSAASQRDAGAIEDAPADDAAPAAKEASDTTSGTTAPLPADTIGKAKAKAVASNGKAADQAAADTPAVPAETEAPETSAANGSIKPSFTPSVSTPAATRATRATPATPVAPSGPPAYTALPAPVRPAAAPSSLGAGSSYAPPASYPRPDESAGTRSPAPGQPGGGSSGGNGSSHGAASAVTGAASAVTGAASAVTGAAAGLATSVSSAWQRRGSNGRPARTRGTQVRKPAKRQAMLTLARVEPWSVMKFSFVASVVAFIILFVAVAVLYMVLSALGVFDSLQHTVSSITGAQGTSGTDISHYYSASVVLGYTAMLGALNIVLITAMSTVGSVIYNLIAKTIGGIEVTLRETE